MVEIPDLRDDLGYQRDTIFSLTEEIDRLQQYIMKDEQKISRLEAQITPFRVVAIQKYGPDETQALKNLSQDVIPIVRNLSRSVSTSSARPFERQQ
jgi:predicted RNase H-like nuclease (RuvC/YqgF family)